MANWPNTDTYKQTTYGIPPNITNDPYSLIADGNPRAGLLFGFVEKKRIPDTLFRIFCSPLVPHPSIFIFAFN